MMSDNYSDGASEVTPENTNKDQRDIKKSIKVEMDCDGVTVYAVAVHFVYEANKLLEIPARSGEPITKEAHDFVRDCYHVEGCDFCLVAEVPVNYRIVCGDWEEHVPLPYSVINRYMTESQRKNYGDWRKKFKPDQYRIRYLQLLGIF